MSPQQHDHDDHGEREIRLTAIILDPRSEQFRFDLPRHSQLLEVLQTGANLAAAQLLPNDDEPLDQLRNFTNDRDLGPPIADLTEDIGTFVRRPHTTRHFGIELVRAFRVNTRWAVAPEASMTPRQILELPLIGLDYTQYTLYLPGSTEPLPLEVDVRVARGQAFEAQRDGRYG